MLSYIAYSQILFPVGDVTITIAKIVLFSDVKYIYISDRSNSFAFRDNRRHSGVLLSSSSARNK